MGPSGHDEKGSWMLRGSEQHDGEVSIVEFSRSGVHALTVDLSSMRVWGRDKDGWWAVKGIIPVTDVWTACFHPAAEHLIVFWCFRIIQILEIRPVPEPECR